MAVVISDFEVVAEPPESPATPDAPEAASERVVLTPQEVEVLMERQAERASRVRAH